MNNIVLNIKNKIKDNKVIVACSTGVDSCVLLNLCLSALNKEQIIVAHVNHGVRIESKDEEEYIKSFCKNNNLIFEVEHLCFDSSSNFESVARSKRYAFFESVAAKYQVKYVLLAHHANDNLETMLMRFMKQSSLKGYAGIEEETFFRNLILYRPLLKVSRLEIEEYANNNGIKYFNDESNSEYDYLRNRIRLDIVPFLMKENPNLIEAVNYYNESLLGAAKLLEDFVSDFIKCNVIITDDFIKFKCDKLFNLNDYLVKEVLFSLLKPYGLSRTLINEIIKVLKSEKQRVVNKLMDNLTLVKEYGNCIFIKKEIKELEFSVKICDYGTYDLIDNAKFIVDKNNCYFTTGNSVVCYNNISMPFVVRTRRDGDKIIRKRVNKQTNEVSFYKQKVSDVLTNKKVSYLDRVNTLVITNESDDVLIILGLTIS